MAAIPRDLLTGVLKDVSRSFYLTLRALPGVIRPPIGLAYLLARTTDTIADTALVPLDQRLQALQSLSERIQGVHNRSLGFDALARQQELPVERLLLEKVEAGLAALGTLSATDLQLVRTVLDTIASGQELDLRRFAGASAGNIIALRTDAELDDYTYRVAGCVGEFWTNMCRAHLFPKVPLDDSFLLTNGVRFGKGLQLVNILRDLPEDLRTGRCYLPVENLTASSLTPEQLLEPRNEPGVRPLYNRYLDLAEAHLAAGWDYTNALPRHQARVRLACAWPILIGAKTIARLRTHNVLDPQRRIKISRPEVRGLIVRSVLCYWLPGAWQRLVSLPRAAAGKAVASVGNLT